MGVGLGAVRIEPQGGGKRSDRPDIISLIAGTERRGHFAGDGRLVDDVSIAAGVDFGLARL